MLIPTLQSPAPAFVPVGEFGAFVEQAANESATTAPIATTVKSFLVMDMIYCFPL